MKLLTNEYLFLVVSFMFLSFHHCLSDIVAFCTVLLTMLFCSFVASALKSLQIASQWVVQNFFQKQLPGETPTKWLHRLLSAVVNTQQISSASITGSGSQGPLLLDHPATGDNNVNELQSRDLTSARQKSTLQNIFSPMEAVTMQIPSYDSKDLANLHSVDMKHLGLEYMRDLNQLWNTIEGSLNKQRTRKQSGSTLHSFLKVLVKSSNSKNFQQLPSMWQAHIDRTKTDARDAVGSIFTQRSAKYELSVPLPMKTFKSDMTRVATAAKSTTRTKYKEK